MIRAKLLYAALLVISILFFILYRGVLSFELLIFTILFPFPFLISVIGLKRAMKTELFHSKEPILKGKFFQWMVQITNKSIFSCPNAQMTFEYRNSLNDTPRELTMIVPVLRRNKQRIRLTFHAVTCGVMQIQLKKIVIFDAMRLFHRTLYFDLNDSVVIMPEPMFLIPAELPPVPQPDADTTEYSKVKAGDDPSEIFDLHQYREGDLVSRIHWKLSSKLDALMVKEYSLPISAGCLLLADHRHIGEGAGSALRVDTMFSAMFAAAAELNGRGQNFAVASYHPEHGLQASEFFSSIADSNEWLRHMVTMLPVEPHDRGPMLTALRDFLVESHVYERIMFFTPQLDDALCEVLLAAPNPERITVFTVIAPKEKAFSEDHIKPIVCVPVMQPKPEHPTAEALRQLADPDFDTEVLMKGEALI